MHETNTLGLKVAGITGVFLVVLFGLYWGGRALFFRGEDQSTLQQPLRQEELRRDSDFDGVADLYETEYYNTDPTKADTDGDGVSDLDEILAGSNPAVPGPQDGIRPATGSQVARSDTYTARYLASLPDDIAREDILDQALIEAFISANRGELLPTLPDGAVKTVPGEGANAVSAYLDSISSAHTAALTIVTSADIEAAFHLQVNSQQPQPMQDLVIALTNNVGVLEEAAAPTEAAALHTKFVAASRALRDNAAALRDIQQDFVGGLIAAKNIEALGGVFQEIAQEVQALETQYGLE